MGFQRDAAGSVWSISAEQANWSYQVAQPNGTTRSLSLDGRIEFTEILDPAARKRVQDWAMGAAARVLVPDETRAKLRGVVFEVRQGYKSKDSKRQNADLSNAANAYAALYLPILFLLSTQIDPDVANRYTIAKWVLLTGTTDGSALESAYVFCAHVVGFDLAGFFKSHSPVIKAKVQQVLEALLNA